jgi:hypothetical protein
MLAPVCMSYSIIPRQIYVIMTWLIRSGFDEINQLKMGMYNIEENVWTITRLFGFSISGGKSLIYFH